MIEKVLNIRLKIFNINLSGKDIFKHPLFSGSAVMIIGSNSANFLAYIYHVIVGRMLGPEHYGALASFLALLGIFSVAFTFLSLVIVKFVSISTDEERSGLYSYLFRKALMPSIFVGVLVTFASPLISNFLHLDLRISFLLGPTIIISFFGLLYRSFLQGMMKFSKVIFMSNLEMLLRAVLGIFLIYMGVKSFGAPLGILLSTFFVFLLARYYLSDIRNFKSSKIFTDGTKMFKFALPVLVFALSSNSFIMTDVILVKHYLSTFDAGIYASVSTLGKIIFYAAAPISSVMFPIISQRYSNGQEYKKIFISSLLLTSGISLVILIAYLAIPVFMVKVLYGFQYISASKYLWRMGLFLATFSVSNLILSYYLSIEKSKIIFLVPVFSLAQIIGIILLHNEIIDVINVSLYTSLALLLFLLVYFIYEK